MDVVCPVEHDPWPWFALPYTKSPWYSNKKYDAGRGRGWSIDNDGEEGANGFRTPLTDVPYAIFPEEFHALEPYQLLSYVFQHVKRCSNI
jgi:hypothetical protein